LFLSKNVYTTSDLFSSEKGEEKVYSIWEIVELINQLSIIIETGLYFIHIEYMSNTMFARPNVMQKKSNGYLRNIRTQLNKHKLNKPSLYHIVILAAVLGAAFTIYCVSTKKLIEESCPLIKDMVNMSSKTINITYKIIITMATYERPNNKSLYYLQRSVRSILMQNYHHWELFASGDKYLSEAQFKQSFDGVPKNKLFLYNLHQPGERNNLTGKRLWFCAGATALNNALNRALQKYRKSKKFENNELLVAHLDDDDTWHPDHLQNLVNMYHRFPCAEFIWSKGYYCTSSAGATVFPDTNLLNTINNMPPTLDQTLHSTVSWKMKTFQSFRYRRAWEFINESPKPADADLWERMSKFMQLNNISFYHSSLPTVEHLEEFGRKPCAKADKQPLWYPDPINNRIETKNK